MPNWCENILTIEGKPEALLRFASQITFDGRHYEIIDSLYPIPAELMEYHSPSQTTPEQQARLKEMYGAADSYRWALDHWGSKWGDCHTKLVSHEAISDGVLAGWLEFRFDSAWSPPDVALCHIARLFPDLYFVLEFGEPGMGFRGYFTAEGEDCGTDYSDGEDHCHYCGQIVDWDDDSCVFCGNNTIHNCPICGRAHAEWLDCKDVEDDEED